MITVKLPKDMRLLDVINMIKGYGLVIRMNGFDMEVVRG